MDIFDEVAEQGQPSKPDIFDQVATPKPETPARDIFDEVADKQAAKEPEPVSTEPERDTYFSGPPVIASSPSQTIEAAPAQPEPTPALVHGSRLRPSPAYAARMAGEESTTDKPKTILNANGALDTLDQAALGVSKTVAGFGKSFEGLSAAVYRVPAVGDLLKGFDRLTGSDSDQAMERARWFSETQKDVSQLSDQTAGSKGVGKFAELATGFLPMIPAGSAAPIVIGLQNFGDTYVDAYEAYKAKGVDDETARDRAFLPAATTGVTSGLIWWGVGRFSGGKLPVQKWIEDMADYGFKDAATEILKGTGMQAGAGALDALSRDIVAQKTYNPNITWQDAVKDAVASAITQGVIGLGFEAIHGAARANQIVPAIKQARDAAADYQSRFWDAVDSAKGNKESNDEFWTRITTPQDEPPRPTVPSHEPTEEQKASGEYPKQAINIGGGLTLSVENNPESTRSGKAPDGSAWNVTMPATYGEIEGSKGADGDKVDAYLGQKPNDTVYVIDQIDPKTGKFDESKAMINFADRDEALQTYQKAFSDGSGQSRIGGVTEMPMDEFSKWVKSKRAKQSLTPAEPPKTAQDEPPSAATPAPVQQSSAAPAATGGAERPDFTSLIDFEGRSLISREGKAGKKGKESVEPAFFEVKDPEAADLSTRLVSDSSPGKDLSKNNSHRITFFEDQDSAEVIGLPTWKPHKGEVMVASPEGKKHGVKLSSLIEAGKLVPVASARVVTPLHSAEVRFRYADMREFEDRVANPSKEQLAAGRRTAAAMEETADASHKITTDEGDEVETSGVTADQNLDREVHEAIQDALPRGADGKIKPGLLPSDIRDALLFMFEQPENKSLLHHVYTEALLELGKEDGFLDQTPAEQERQLIQQITAKFYDKYKSGTFEKDYAADQQPAALAAGTEQRSKTQGATAAEAAQVSRPDADRSAQPGPVAEPGADATARPVLQADAAQGAGARPVLSGEPSAETAANGVTRVVSIQPYHTPNPFTQDFVHPEIAALGLRRETTVADVVDKLRSRYKFGSVSRSLADLVSNLVGDTKITFVNQLQVEQNGRVDEAAGIYHTDGTILISARGLVTPAEFAHTLFHEAVHAATEAGINGQNIPGLGLTDEEFNDRQLSLFADLSRVLTQARKVAAEKNAKFYGLRSINDLMAEGMVNKDFQAFLKTVEIEGVRKRQAPTAWGKLVEAVSRFLGFSDNTALDHVMSLTAEASELAKHGTLEGIPVDKSQTLTVQPRLIETPEERSETHFAEDDLPARDKQYLAASEQSQNGWVRLPIFKGLPKDILDRLSFLGERESVLKASEKEAGSAGMTFDQIEEAIKAGRMNQRIGMALEGDMMQNLLSAESDFAKAKESNEQTIKTNRQNAADILVDERRLLPGAQTFSEESVRKVVSSAQDRLQRMRNLPNQDKDAINTQIRSLGAVAKEGSTIFERIFSALAKSNFEQAANTQQIFESAGITPESIGTTPEFFNAAASAFLADKGLGERLLGYRLLSDNDQRQRLLEAGKVLSEAITKGTEGDWENINRQTLLDLRAVSPELADTLKEVRDGKSTIAAIDQINQNGDWRDLRAKVYRQFKMSAFVLTGGQSSYTFEVPGSDEKVTITATLNGPVGKENQAKLEKLFQSAIDYINNPDALGYDPKTAIAWEQLIPDKSFWINDSWNPQSPRYVRHKLSAIAPVEDLLSSVERLSTGLAGQEWGHAQAALDGLTDITTFVHHHEHARGEAVDRAVARAAELHEMSVQDWRDWINKALALRQSAGQVRKSVGDSIEGRIITPTDQAAVDTYKTYHDALRDLAEGREKSGAGRVNAARIRTEKGFRLAFETSPTGETVPGRFNFDAAHDWLSQWQGIKVDEARAGELYDAMSPEQKANPDEARKAAYTSALTEARAQWLSQSEAFRQVLMDHMRFAGRTPDYRIKSPYRTLYRALANEFDTGRRMTFQDVVDQIFDARTNDTELADKEQGSKDDVRTQIVGEIDKLFRTIEARIGEDEKVEPQDLVSRLSSKNSFSLPRNESAYFPPTFTDWGALLKGERMVEGDGVVRQYLTELLGRDGAFDRLKNAFDAAMNDYNKRIKGRRSKGIAEIEKDVESGTLFYDYQQLVRAKARVDKLYTELKNSALTKRPNDVSSSAVRRFGGRMTSSLMGSLLAGPARLTHTIGNMDVTYFLLRDLYGSFGGAKTVGRRAVEQIGNVIPAVLSELGLFKRAEADKLAAPVRWLAEMVQDRRARIQELQDLGLADSPSLGEKARAFGDAWRSIFKDLEGTHSLPQRVGAFAGSGWDVFNAALHQLPILSARFNDIALHLSDRNTIIDMENRLKSAAIRSYDAKALRGDTEYRLTPQELLGRRTANARESLAMRELMRHAGIFDLDRSLSDYYQNYKEAKAKGGSPVDLAAVPFLDDGQKAALQWNFGQMTGRSSLRNRPQFIRESKASQNFWMLYGLPMWALERYEQTFTRVSTESRGEHLMALLPRALAIAAVMAAGGVTLDEGRRLWRQYLYGERSSLPSLLNARSPKDVAHIIVRGWASVMPLIGDAVNLALDTPYRFGNTDSPFLLPSLLSNVTKALVKGAQTRDPVTPLMDLLRRYVPVARIAMNAVGYNTGLTRLYNAANDIQSTVPDTIESKKRNQVSGGMNYTPATPLVRAMQDAAMRGDTAAFHAAYQKAVEEKRSEGVQNPEQSIAASFTALDPWMMKLGRLPTDAERQLVLSRMSEAQRQEVTDVEQSFQRYGDMIGARTAITAEEGSGRVGSIVGTRSGSGSVTPTGAVRGSSARSTGSRLTGFTSGLGGSAGSAGGSVGAGAPSGGGRIASGSRQRGSRLRGSRLSSRTRFAHRPSIRVAHANRRFRSRLG